MSDGHKVYVGNLPSDIRERDLEDMFYKYGKIVEVDLHARKGIPFAFIEFEDSRDAEDAIRGKDGYTFDGCRLRVEYPRSSRDGRRDSFRGYSGGGGGGGGRGFGGGRGGGGGGRGGRRPKGFQLSVTGLPPTGSWQDIKDHFRQAGDVIFADVFRDGTGVVEFMKSDHAKRALRDLDDSKFKSHEGETAYIRVKDRERSRSRSYSPRHSPRRSRSRSPRRSPVRRSPKYSPRRSPKYSPRYSRSRSRSYSPRRSRSRSGSR